MKKLEYENRFHSFGGSVQTTLVSLCVFVDNFQDKNPCFHLLLGDDLDAVVSFTPADKHGTFREETDVYVQCESKSQWLGSTKLLT